jgi:predicted NUDIX family NTP pyrophosphohydrolase
MGHLARHRRGGMMAAISAGIMLYRRAAAGIEIFLVHPGGPFWAKKDEAGWSIPKGLVEPGETHLAAARREFTEEVGAVPPGELRPLGAFRQSGGKTIVAFALEGDFDPDALVSNSIEIDWPPRSGQKLTIPEVDRAGWFGIEGARLKLHLGQRPILAALLALEPWQAL